MTKALKEANERSQTPKKKASNDITLLDSVANLTADITDSPKGADVKRLRFLIASALKLQQQKEYYTTPKKKSPIMQLFSHEYYNAVRETIRAHLVEAESSYVETNQVLEVRRRDVRETLLDGRLVDNLSGLLPDERIGPFVVEGDTEIWFDVFFAARRLVIIETGASIPALVLTHARPPKTGGISTSIHIEQGTVWLRGDLIDGSLPTGAFVGVKVSSGLVKLAGPASVDGDKVEVGSPLRGQIRLELAPDEVTPDKNGCSSANSKIELPQYLRFRFGSGPPSVKGVAGKAQAWGQIFEFSQSKDSWFFIEALWTAVLQYKVKTQKLDTSQIKSALIDFNGTAQINKGGLGLPVVVPIDTSILGEVANAPSWWLAVNDFAARWYEPEQRLHVIDNAFVGISCRDTIICAEHVPPLNPPVTQPFMLWSISGSHGQRVLWQQKHEQPFMLFHRCDVLLGEHLLVGGNSTVVLDRPVQANGKPIATPTNQGVLLLHQFGEQITGMLGSAISQDGAVQQLALRNALVWTTRPTAIFVQGSLEQPQSFNAGTVQLIFGVHAWAPILPDPYVSNFNIRKPDIGKSDTVKTLLLAKISWLSVDDINVSFEGQFGPPLVFGKDASSGEPKPAPAQQGNPYVGPTQVSQNKLSLDRESAVQWNRARDKFEEGKKRASLAQDRNEELQQIINRYLLEVLGPSPQMLLLDVSTNQDLLGVALGAWANSQTTHTMASTLSPSAFPVSHLETYSKVSNMRIIMLPQVLWEPVRTLDPDQDIITLGWFPTPLASATDGGVTQLGAYSQRLVPHIPDEVLKATYNAYSEGTPVAFRTTLSFGLVAVVQLYPKDMGTRRADVYQLTQPKFPAENSIGGLHITAQAEGGRADADGVSPNFNGRMYQLINGVDLASGAPLGLSVLGSTADPGGSVETVFNNDMVQNPRVPVTRFDLSGYGGSNFSDWNNPFAAFAQAAKVQFCIMVGRTALEVIKVNSVLHPWGIRVTRSITVERRPGGGVIRRDSGWQAFTPGLFDYRYQDEVTKNIEVAPYTFDAGIFQGLFNVRSIRPAPGSAFSFGNTTMIPYYFDAEVALKGLPERTHAIGVLGYLQTKPSGEPASVDALRNLLETQGPIGGPIDVWLDFGGSGLPFRARRIEMGLALDGSNPVFVATVRGVPKLPKTGAWSVVVRPVSNVSVGGGEAVPVSETQGVPLIRRYPIRYFAGDTTVYSEPPREGPPSVEGDYRFADAADLLVPATPANEYALLQSTPTHAFLFPRPYVVSSSPPRIQSDTKAALADLIARSTSKGAFPPPQNTIELAAGSLHFDVGPDGTLALSSPINIVSYSTPLRIAGSKGHGSTLFYDDATLTLELQADRWMADFIGLRIWTDIMGMERLTGSELRIVGSTNQRPQIAELKSLILSEIEEILRYIPLFGARGVQGPIDLGASNAKHEIKVEAKVSVTIPTAVSFAAGADLKLKLDVKQSTGYDLKTSQAKASATFGAALDGRVPVLSVGVASVFVVVTVKVEFSITSLSGEVTAEKLDFLAFAGMGVEGRIGPFKAYAFLGIGFVLSYDIVANQTKYGGLVALEAGVDLKIVEVKIRAELKGLVYDDAGATKCDYSGSVKLEVDLFLIFSISVTYQVTETAVISGGSP